MITINDTYPEKKLIVEPLTYLTLMLAQNQEKISNAEGYYVDKTGYCRGYYDDNTNLVRTEDGKPIKCKKNQANKQIYTVDSINELIKNNNELSDINETLKKDVDKAGGWKNFWNNFTTWSKTEQGQGTLNSAGMLAGGLFGNQQTPEVDSRDYQPQESTGMNPIWWVLIGIGGLALLGGLAFGIYKLSVKKSVPVTTTA